MTSSDVGLRIRCNYNLTNRTVTHTSSLEVNDGSGSGLGEAAMQTTAVAAPNVTMRITLRDGNDITSAKVGDHLALRFEIEKAKSNLRLACDKNPPNPNAYYNLSLMLQGEGKYGKSASLLEEGLKKVPDNERLLYALLIAEVERSDLSKAKETCIRSDGTTTRTRHVMFAIT